MDADSPLKFFTNNRCLPGLSQSTPKSRVQQDYIYGIQADAGGELLKIYDDRVRCGGNLNEWADTAHSLQSPAGILEVVIPDTLYGASDANGFLNAPGGIRVQPKRILGKFGCERQVNLQIVVRDKNATF